MTNFVTPYMEYVFTLDAVHAYLSGARDGNACQHVAVFYTKEAKRQGRAIYKANH